MCWYNCTGQSKERCKRTIVGLTYRGPGQKWNVLGETRVGIFANRDIAAGTELTFDYKVRRFSTRGACPAPPLTHGWPVAAGVSEQLHQDAVLLWGVQLQRVYRG
jgi:hypothetical protein